MLHVREDLATGTEEHVGIAVLVVKFGDGTVITTETREGEGIAMDKRLTLLAVALRGKGIDAVGYKLEKWLIITIVCHILFQ